MTTSHEDVRTTTTHQRAVVVGSGFGGGVTALRLCEAGVPTLLLERGMRWETGPDADTFARFADLDNRSAWLSDHSVVRNTQGTWAPYTGVLEAVVGDGMTATCGAGLGGGSLMYHGMTLQPSAEDFAASMPLAAHLYEELDEWAYPTVARMLQVSTVPDDVLAADPYASSRAFLEVAPKASLQPFHVPLPVDWEYVRGELDGRYTATYTTSDLAFGVNNGGKHSIDVTYLRAAEETGLLDVRTQHVVRDLARIDGLWELRVDRIDTDGTVLEHLVITSDAVFLNAGSTGTTRLLVKARAKGLVPDLPEAVGTQWGNNGDRIYAWIGMDAEIGSVQGGPACVGGRDIDSVVPFAVIHAGSPVQPPGVKMMTVVGFGVVDAAGTWAYDADDDDAHLTWPASGDAALREVLADRMQRIAAAGGGQMVDTDAASPGTWHALGGVPMGDAVDLYGRVHGNPGLYVLDGARIPGSTGACNPSMTIAALAEHSMATLVREDLGVVF